MVGVKALQLTNLDEDICFCRMSAESFLESRLEAPDSRLIGRACGARRRSSLMYKGPQPR